MDLDPYMRLPPSIAITLVLDSPRNLLTALRVTMAAIGRQCETRHYVEACYAEPQALPATMERAVDRIRNALAPMGVTVEHG